MQSKIALNYSYQFIQIPTYTISLLKSLMLFSTLPSYASISVFLFCIAIVFIDNGNFWISASSVYLVAFSSTSMSWRSSSGIRLVPGGAFAFSSSTAR